MPVAGPQTVDTVKQIKSSKSKCIVIGVDTAQEKDPTTNETGSFTDKSGNRDIVKFSAMKNIADITSKILSLSYAGKVNNAEEPGGEYTIGSYGYLTVGDYSNDGIMPSENS
jgi:basic membrane lipoprotein Med (substrate-binding protein (PBP1-ABC) superfamily)